LLTPLEAPSLSAPPSAEDSAPFIDESHTQVRVPIFADGKHQFSVRKQHIAPD